MFAFQIKFYVKYDHGSEIQGMAWRRKGAIPIPEPMVANICKAIRRRSATMS